ncbi:uncharacterized protein [Battus philenor]|uniref:uncharacterized protein n=1 Tax=Battus philenor TaxID=42288 RepID=UPI0035D0B647
MCDVLLSHSRSWVALFGYLIVQTYAYPMQAWPMYSQTPREYRDDDYDYAPKVQYYYDAPALNVPDAYGETPYSYYYDPYGHFANEAPDRQEERLASLPIGQETWFESDNSPRWRSSNLDDVNAAFLDNLILTQMAQDAQRRRENARAAFSTSHDDYEDRDNEDEDVRELKALAGKPIYHVPKTAPKYEDEEYPSDDGFINWNGNKRSETTDKPIPNRDLNIGEKEIAIPRPAKITKTKNHEKRSSPYYNSIAQLLENKSHKSTSGHRMEKRFVAGDSDLVLELRGLKHRIAT